MNSKLIAMAFIIIGVVLLIFGVSAWQSVSSEISEAVSGMPNTKSIVLFVVGIAFLAMGGSMVMRTR